MAQQAIQTVTEFGLLDFLCIGRADGIDAVGIHQPALDEGKIAMKFQPVHAPQSARQTQIEKHLAIEQALISQVVDGEQRGRALQKSIEQRRHQRRLPVIAMRQCGPPAESDAVECDIHRDLRKQGETQRIVGPGFAGGIEIGIAGAVEQAWAMHQPGDDIAAGQGGLQ